MFVGIAFDGLVIIVELVALQKAGLIETPSKIIQFSESFHTFRPCHRLFHVLCLVHVENAALVWFAELKIIIRLVTHELAFRVHLLNEVQIVVDACAGRNDPYGGGLRLVLLG
jgi:hypothetical protein